MATAARNAEAPHARTCPWNAKPERDAAREPRHVHERVVPAAERERAPHLQQRHGGGVARGRVGEHLRRVGADPLRERHEGRHVAQLEPHARLGGPLHPRVPGDRAGRHTSSASRPAKRTATAARSTAARIAFQRVEPGPVGAPVRRRERRAAAPRTAHTGTSAEDREHERAIAQKFHFTPARLRRA